MSRKRNTSVAKRRRRLHDEPQSSFWRDYDSTVGLLDQDEDWEIALGTHPETLTYSPPSRKVPRGTFPGFDLDRMLTRPRNRFPDFDQLTERLSTGGMVKTRTEAEALVAAGVTHVLNTSGELYDEHLIFSGMPITYLYNPTPDDFRWKDPEWFYRTLDFALPAIADGGHVYAHCLEGVNRGPSSAAAILLALGYAPREAKELIQRVRPRAKVAYLADAMDAIARREPWT